MRKFSSDEIANFLCESVRSVPWNRGTWSGKFASLDGTETTDFTESNIDTSPEQDIGFVAKGVDDWDGDCSVVFRLKDGRWVAYESTWGPTGSGFSEDAYGGDADILFAKTREYAIKFGISESVQPAVRPTKMPEFEAWLFAHAAKGV